MIRSFPRPQYPTSPQTTAPVQLWNTCCCCATPARSPISGVNKKAAPSNRAANEGNHHARRSPGRAVRGGNHRQTQELWGGGTARAVSDAEHRQSATSIIVPENSHTDRCDDENGRCSGSSHLARQRCSSSLTRSSLDTSTHGVTRYRPTVRGYPAASRLPVTPRASSASYANLLHKSETPDFLLPHGGIRRRGCKIGL
jgi:hypothetical protein